MKKKNALFIIIISILSVCLITVSSLYIHTLTNKKESEITYYDMKCHGYEVNNHNLLKEQIVFIGDSITDLCQLDLYYDDLDLKSYNRGIGGDTTDGVLKRLKVSLYDISPSIVVLMIGTNDIIGNKDNTEILNNYKKIIKNINETLVNSKLICMSIIPSNYDINEYSNVDVINHNNNVIYINNEINKLTSTYNFTYVDIYSLLIDDNKVLKKECSDDGLHLNHNGFIIWSNAIKHLLK